MISKFKTGQTILTPWNGERYTIIERNAKTVQLDNENLLKPISKRTNDPDNEYLKFGNRIVKASDVARCQNVWNPGYQPSQDDLNLASQLGISSKFARGLADLIKFAKDEGAKLFKAEGHHTDCDWLRLARPRNLNPIDGAFSQSEYAWDENCHFWRLISDWWFIDYKSEQDYLDSGYSYLDISQFNQVEIESVEQHELNSFSDKVKACEKSAAAAYYALNGIPDISDCFYKPSAIVRQYWLNESPIEREVKLALAWDNATLEPQNYQVVTTTDSCQVVTFEDNSKYTGDAAIDCTWQDTINRYPQDKGDGDRFADIPPILPSVGNTIIKWPVDPETIKEIYSLDLNSEILPTEHLDHALPNLEGLTGERS